jgi:inner membrane protein
MDNLCHTLTGWALSEAGLKKRTPLGAAALLIGANVADVDGLAYFKGTLAALCIRRGLTHGILAMALWPFLITGLFLAWDRAVRRRQRPDLSPARPGPLLLLSAIGVLSHPLLDFLNTYGVRLLSPFSDRWFYGDALFIVDPWLWLLLGGGALLSHRAGRRGASGAERPARIALGLAGAYAVLMLAGGRVVAGRIAEAFTSGGKPVESVLAAPLPGTPVHRLIVVDEGSVYALGSWEPLARPQIRFLPDPLPKESTPGLAQEAAATENGRRFLQWARYPIFERLPDGEVLIRDARYVGRAGSWATLRIPAPVPLR